MKVREVMLARSSLLFNMGVMVSASVTSWLIVVTSKSSVRVAPGLGVDDMADGR